MKEQNDINMYQVEWNQFNHLTVAYEKDILESVFLLVPNCISKPVTTKWIVVYIYIYTLKKMIILI